MHISFELTMPQNNSWNGRWSGEDRKYVRVLTVSDATKTRDKFTKLIGNHYYSFGDGWGANVKVKEVTGQEKRKLVKSSAGFCGYDWMIESLRWYGRIMNDQQKREHIAAGNTAQ